MQSEQARVPVPPLRSQNRPRIGRGDRGVAQVRGTYMQTYVWPPRGTFVHVISAAKRTVTWQCQ